MLKPTAVAALAAAIVATGPQGAYAATVTIGALHDATIFQNNVNNSNGAGPGIFAGSNSNLSARRGLISFDIAGNVPTGATITGVDLTLFLGQSAGSGGNAGGGDQTPRTISLYSITSPWGEGTTGSTATGIGGTGQGYTANPGDATWNANFYNTSTWTTPGGDHVAAASASLVVNNVFQAPYTWQSTPQLVSDVQGWLDHPSANYGWELINATEAGFQTFRAFYTKEWSDPTMRPQLAISYTPAPVPVPAAVWLFGTGIAGLLGFARRKITG
ncbi:DNRLRE domain-containing protein [Methylococcus sp. EFPC2]|uniref:DNRLRE domain-containing protein n=1 Tax=Methylococcus sp. EFPC2 TaxID=2812648 RepID=UPI0019678DF4|nr:DNRLRE domain-containing protein [Methylococcus sp. EFPC2]QSA95753.1 DNRLRE domain-containing protein [Methylococcus sp. EFPC2]